MYIAHGPLFRGRKREHRRSAVCGLGYLTCCCKWWSSDLFFLCPRHEIGVMRRTMDLIHNGWLCCWTSQALRPRVCSTLHIKQPGVIMTADIFIAISPPWFTGANSFAFSLATITFVSSFAPNDSQLMPHFNPMSHSPTIAAASTHHVNISIVLIP